MKTIFIVSVIALAFASAADSQSGATAQAQEQSAAGRGRGRGTGGGAGTQAIGSAEIAPLIFEEHWMDLPNAEPITHEHVSNANLVLHIYGDTNHIRATKHPTEAYTYTGETITNWALTLSDPKFYYDLSGTGKVMLRTRNSGYRFTHVVIKTMDGQWFASEEGSPESSSWINREYALPDLHWRVLLMTDTPTNASNQRTPDPKLVPIIPLGVGHPDLTKVDEVGFSDLMPGGWIPATSRVNSWAVYGKKVAR